MKKAEVIVTWSLDVECPFCGTLPRIFYDEYAGGDYRSNEPWFIGCSNMECRCDLGWFATGEAAISEWNTR